MIHAKEATLSSTFVTIEQILPALAAAPARIAEVTAGMTPAQLQAAPNPGEWSTSDVLAHLRACADVWGDCISAIIAQDRPTLRAVNPRTWIKSTDYPTQDFRSSLRAFTRQRSRLVAQLTPLALEDWSRRATVTGAGKALERTVLSYAQGMASHERPHLKQIKRIASLS